MKTKYYNYDITVVVTHRCNAKCIMCNSYDSQICSKDELSLENIKKIPPSKFIQITGGEPFMRPDLEKIVEILSKKSKRLMINTNGYFTEGLVALCKKYPDLAIRISIDGDREVHNSIRRIDIYDKAIESLDKLKELGIIDLGISFTLQEKNYDKMLDLYKFALEKKVDFGVSIIHNSFYFSKNDNSISNESKLINELERLVQMELKSSRKKDWARAFFNDMSINYIEGKPMPVKCDAGRTSFTIECTGEVLPCNMTPVPWVMGNIKNNTWDDIISSDDAHAVIEKCRNCKFNCWSVCNVQSALKKNLFIPGTWLIVNKLKRQKRNI